MNNRGVYLYQRSLTCIFICLFVSGFSEKNCLLLTFILVRAACDTFHYSFIHVIICTTADTEVIGLHLSAVILTRKKEACVQLLPRPQYVRGQKSRNVLSLLGLTLTEDLCFHHSYCPWIVPLLHKFFCPFTPK